MSRRNIDSQTFRKYLKIGISEADLAESSLGNLTNEHVK